MALAGDGKGKKLSTAALFCLCLFILSGWIAGAGWYAVAWLNTLRDRGYVTIGLRLKILAFALAWPWWIPVATAYDRLVGQRKRREALQETIRALKGKVKSDAKRPT